MAQHTCIYRVTTNELKINGELVGYVEPGQIIVNTNEDYINSPVIEFDGNCDESWVGYKICPAINTEEFLRTRNPELLNRLRNDLILSLTTMSKINLNYQM